MKSRTISIVFVRSLLSSSRCNKVDIMELLKQAQIPQDLFNNDKARISINMFAELSRAVYKHLQDESAGYYPSPLKPGTSAILANYMLGAANLQQAILRCIEFYNLFDTGFHLTVHQLANNNIAFRMNCDPFLNYPPWIYELVLMSCHRLFCWVTETHFLLENVSMNYPKPSHVDEYHFLFACPVTFKQPHSQIVFNQQHLALNTVKDEGRIESYKKNFPFHLLMRPRNEKSYVEQVRRCLKSALPNIPEYETIANTLNIHPQTLRRRLKNEGCDYRQIRNELIRDTAMSYLRRNELEIKQISYALGFSEPSAFIRSFKRWTGTTPNQYRRNQKLLNTQAS